jgi:hypothetical protein
MGAFIAKLVARFAPEGILMLGLDNAGKTTL